VTPLSQFIGCHHGSAPGEPPSLDPGDSSAAAKPRGRSGRGMLMRTSMASRSNGEAADLPAGQPGCEQMLLAVGRQGLRGVA
jgi:hypothetical protein